MLLANWQKGQIANRLGRTRELVMRAKIKKVYEGRAAVMKGLVHLTTSFIVRALAAGERRV